MRGHERSGLALALVSAVGFGLSGSLGKALTDAGWSASGAVFVRLSGGAVVLLGILAFVRPGVVAAIRADGGALAVYGLLAAAGVQVTFYNALIYLPVTIALLLQYLGSILVIAWVWVVRRQPPGSRTVLGAAVALIGLALVMQVWNSVGLPWEGVVWGLASAVCQAAYFLVADRPGNRTPPLVLAGIGMTIGTVAVGLLGIAGLLRVVIDTSAMGVTLGSVDIGWPVAATLLVVVTSVIPYLTGVAAIARIGAARGSLVGLLEVVTSAVASWLLLRQVPTAVEILGGVLILAGVALTNTARSAGVAEPEPGAR
ncbi:EamA family transporter [Pseudonocardia alaniniphila]|uniref:EamA family transporter n=1 Tax=Pseudonocardia alaniniphila TaxID=75291 RepID=A0ABS9TR38_9PSEU|nr:EamA family transporter [Pseudonocardia alaniniphila]MCH6170893.1 EamA family transporter [Pseudonocardia alaniniphila]